MTPDYNDAVARLQRHFQQLEQQRQAVQRQAAQTPYPALQWVWPERLALYSPGANLVAPAAPLRRDADEPLITAVQATFLHWLYSL